MEPKEYEKMYQMEETHWWFVSKRNLVRSFLEKTDGYILDIGCGTGANLKSFSNFGKVIGIDVSPLAMSFSSRRGCPYLVRASADNLPFKDNIFDAVTLLDVLYHRMVERDKGAMAEVSRIVKQDGRIIITDSALEFLRSAHDAAVHGMRRYNKKNLRQVVQDAGFRIERLTYINFLLFPLVFVIRLWKKFFRRETDSSDLKPVYPILNNILLKVQELEGLLLRFFNLPVGSSIFCVARKMEST